MSNTISLSVADADVPDLRMQNGLTSVFISTFGLAATRLADTDDQRLLTIWFLEKDQSVVGMGSVGFDLVEAPFLPAAFETQRAFMLQSTGGMTSRLGWETLSYEPNPRLLDPSIASFAALLNHVTREHLDIAAAEEWRDSCGAEELMFSGFPTCTQHKILSTVFGCHACNDR
ncbi:hypothetical protein [Leucobacter sp. NPDC077196]|uniref:hypothetical protein n=1 Tax=Leucobacter sp. NPDC077196 TaxID=3154959 RepID=UPI0034126E9F